MFDLSILKKPLWPRNAYGWRVYLAYPPISILAGFIGVFFFLIAITLMTAMDYHLTALDPLTPYDSGMTSHPQASVLLGLVLGIIAARIEWHISRKELGKKIELLLDTGETSSLRSRVKTRIVNAATGLTAVTFVFVTALVFDLSFILTLVGLVSSFLAFNLPTSKLIYDGALARLAGRSAQPSDSVERIDRSIKRFFYRVAVPIFLIANVVLSVLSIDALDRLERSRRSALRAYARVMPEEEADALERRLADNPEDTDARAQLLTYLRTRSFELNGEDKEKMRATWRVHLLWFIEHEPKDSASCATISSDDYPEDYGRAKTLWVEHLERRPGDLDLLLAATDFFILNEDDLSLELAQRGHTLDPNNLEWGDRIGKITVEQIRSRVPAPEK